MPNPARLRLDTSPRSERIPLRDGGFVQTGADLHMAAAQGLAQRAGQRGDARAARRVVEEAHVKPGRAAPDVSSNSSGGGAGAPGGVTSGVNMGPREPKQTSSKVYFGGKKATFATGITAHNGSNANLPAGAQVAPSQTKVLVGP